MSIIVLFYIKNRIIQDVMFTYTSLKKIKSQKLAILIY